MPTDIDVTIAASADDAFEDTDGDVVIDGTSTIIEFVDQWGGLRFEVTIPDDAIVVEAWLEVFVHNSSYRDPVTTIYGEDVASAATYEAGIETESISGRDRTSASVLWDNPGLGSNGYHQTPDLLSIVRELVESHSYAEGAYMGFMLTEATSAPGRSLGYRTYDDSVEHAPKLHIRYLEAGELRQGTTTSLLLRLAGGA